VAVTPANAILAHPSATGSAAQPQRKGEDEAVIDKTPIADDAGSRNGASSDGFGGFDDEEDEQYIKRAKKNALRRKGLDPKAASKINGKTKVKSR
jgi:25S rRNA (cytosine2870-C5)-methyltransferase